MLRCCVWEREASQGAGSLLVRPLPPRLKQEYIQELSLLEFGPHFLTQEKLGGRRFASLQTENLGVNKSLSEAYPRPLLAF